MMERPDFFNITVIVIAIYIVEHPERISHDTFRKLAFALLLTFIYDSIWLYEIHQDDAEEALNWHN